MALENGAVASRGDRTKDWHRALEQAPPCTASATASKQAPLNDAESSIETPAKHPDDPAVNEPAAPATPDSNPPGRFQSAHIMTLAFVSGFVIMSIELLGGRILAPYFGSTIYVWGSIISVFMIALSIGYLLGGRMSVRNPGLGRFSLFYFGAALTVLPVIGFANGIMDWTFERITDPRFGSLTAAMMLFFVPTCILGMISPYSVRLLVRNEDHSGQVAGTLYFVSTLGSALGTLATSFYLVLWFEVNRILITLAMVLVVAGVSAALRGGRARRWPAPVLAVAVCPFLLAGVAQPADAKVIHTERSLYQNIVVTETGSRRCLSFRQRGLDKPQSCMDTRDPRLLVFPYVRMTMAGLLLNPSPKRVLVVGLGGGAIPTALTDLFSDVTVDAIEVDPAVHKVARDHFDFTTTERRRVFIADGRVFIKRAIKRGDTYDLVILDAFNGDYIPEHLLTQEFLTEVRDVLTADGVLVANTFATSRLYDHESVTYSAVFNAFLNLRIRISANRVILARKNGLPDDETLARNAEALKDRLRVHGVKLLDFLPDLSRDVDWETNVRALTDQYSPANLLR
jgi:spermidine synthase